MSTTQTEKPTHTALIARLREEADRTTTPQWTHWKSLLRAAALAIEELVADLKHERGNRGEQTKNKRVTHEVLSGLRDEQRERADRAEARVEALEKALRNVASYD